MQGALQKDLFRFARTREKLKRVFFDYTKFRSESFLDSMTIIYDSIGVLTNPLPVFSVFPPAVRWRMMRNLALGLQSAVRITRTRPDHRGLLYGRPALGLSPLHLAPLSLRLDQLISVPPVLLVVSGRRLPTPVPVSPVRLSRTSRLFAVVVRWPTIAMPVSGQKREDKN